MSDDAKRDTSDARPCAHPEKRHQRFNRDGDIIAAWCEDCGAVRLEGYARWYAPKSGPCRESAPTGTHATALRKSRPKTLADLAVVAREVRAWAQVEAPIRSDRNARMPWWPRFEALVEALDRQEPFVSGDSSRSDKGDGDGG